MICKTSVHKCRLVPEDPPRLTDGRYHIFMVSLSSLSHDLSSVEDPVSPAVNVPCDQVGPVVDLVEGVIVSSFSKEQPAENHKSTHLPSLPT
jgi:hypothetical protein